VNSPGPLLPGRFCCDGSGAGAFHIEADCSRSGEGAAGALGGAGGEAIACMRCVSGVSTRGRCEAATDED
jgi:hypothetical protein